MNFRHFLRMKRWINRPPSPMQVKMVIGVILLCVLLVGIEKFVGWPEALRVQKVRF